MWSSLLCCSLPPRWGLATALEAPGQAGTGSPLSNRHGELFMRVDCLMLRPRANLPSAGSWLLFTKPPPRPQENMIPFNATAQDCIYANAVADEYEQRFTFCQTN